MKIKYVNMYIYMKHTSTKHIAEKTKVIYILDLHSSLGESDTL